MNQTRIQLVLSSKTVAPLILIDTIDQIIEEQQVIATVDGGATLIAATATTTTISITAHFDDQEYDTLSAVRFTKLLKTHGIDVISTELIIEIE